MWQVKSDALGLVKAFYKPVPFSESTSCSMKWSLILERKTLMSQLFLMNQKHIQISFGAVFQ